jgi:hypothetical protein
MIERIDDMPAGTLGFRAKGEIEREDYEDVLVPTLRGALANGGKLRALYLIEGLDKIEPSALWADSKLGFDLLARNRDALVRTAIVTDVEWIARGSKMFAWMIPGEVSVFSGAELEQAKAWVAG